MTEMTSQQQQPIGVFDSGAGGLTVLHALQAALPSESFIYVADNRCAPYGDKPTEYVVERSLKITEYLHNRGAKALVIACNTATACAAQVVRARWPEWPVVGIEPAVKPAALRSQTGVVGILATSNTLASEKFRRLISGFSHQAQIIVQACPGLVDEIERGNLHSAHLHALLAEYVGALCAAGADVIVLGCTHYPFVQAQIQALAGEAVTVIETGVAVARELARQLTQHQLCCDQTSAGELEFFCTDEVTPTLQNWQRLLQSGDHPTLLAAIQQPHAIASLPV